MAWLRQNKRHVAHVYFSGVCISPKLDLQTSFSVQLGLPCSSKKVKIPRAKGGLPVSTVSVWMLLGLKDGVSFECVEIEKIGR